MLGFEVDLGLWPSSPYTSWGSSKGRGPQAIELIRGRSSWATGLNRHFPTTTGRDITSKCGTKAAGIKAEPALYLKDFGRAHTDVQDCVQNAEKFRVQVLNRAWH